MLKKIKNYLKNNKSYSISLLIVMIISFLITKLPLINGFTYEFAFIINIILLLLYPIAYKYIYKLNIYKSYIYLLIPIIIQLITIKNLCDPFKGFFFYLLIPTTTLFLIYNLLSFLSNPYGRGVDSSSVLSQDKAKPPYPYLLLSQDKAKPPSPYLLTKYYLIIFLSLIGELYLLYSQPQIFFYNSFWGYFQGSLYDIEFSISMPLICLSIFKIINGLILYLINYIRSSQKKIIKKEKIILAFLIISSITIYFNQTNLGLISTHKSIQKTLGGFYKTQNFNIYYDNNYQIRKNIKLIAQEHEMRLAQLKKMYNIKWNAKIDSYIFKSSKQKKQLMGAGNTLLAKPWLKEIYINYSSEFPHSHLKHELSHVIASKFSNRFLGIPMKFGIIPQMGIVEGFAVSSEDEKGELTLFEQMAILKKINKFPPLEKMVSFDDFWSYNSYFAYQTVGGFLKFLKIKYGVEKLKILYQKESFKSAYNKTILQLKSEYLKFLGNIKINDKYTPRIKSNFSQKSVFKRVCPHDIIEIKENANYLIKNKNFNTGIKYGEKLLKLEPFNVNHKLFLAKLSTKYKKYQKALLYLKEINIKQATITDKMTIELYQANILWYLNKAKKALKIYQDLIKKNISTSLFREIYIKINALKNKNIEIMIKNYLLEKKSIGSYTYYFHNLELSPNSYNIVNYLYGRYYYNYKNYKQALFFLNRITTTLPIPFIIEILKIKIKSYFFLKQYKNSIDLSKKLILFSQTQGSKEFAKNWIKYNQYFNKK